MKYAKIKKFDIANGEGIRVSLFVSGCKFHCKDCFNQEAWDFNYGTEYTAETEKEILEMLADPRIDGLSILGGDPLWQDNNGLEALINLETEVHALGKTIWIWSGYTWDEVLIQGGRQFEVVQRADVFVDGLFQAEKRNLRLQWRGSSNQRVIDVQKTLKEKRLVLIDVIE